MSLALPPLPDLPGLPFDTLIDARAPAEFAEDHIPGAINLPVLSDAERARVGTIYKQQSPFLARKIGGALVAQNIAAHLLGPLADKPGGWRPLVYCWRGGQRSGAFALWLREVGWRAETIAGGYQSYRRAVVAALYDRPPGVRVVLLDGNTGTAKTEILARLAAGGQQVIDLEALANHRGSVLGVRPGGQPPQKMFESRLAAALARLDPRHPVVIEAESAKVGDLIVPPSLWQAMRAAPRILLRADPGDRARYLLRAYADLFAQPDLFAQLLQRLIPLQGHARIAAWEALLRSGAHEALVTELITHHYDARYARARSRDAGPQDKQLAITLDPAGLDRAADLIAARIGAQIGAQTGPQIGAD